MTRPVIWYCRACDKPVSFTCRLEPLDSTTYRVHAEPHINAHQAQHR